MDGIIISRQSSCQVASRSNQVRFVEEGLGNLYAPERN